ncbi:MAG: hypothetical protein ACOCU9_03755, partial [Spirochaetota bacterium]
PRAIAVTVVVTFLLYLAYYALTNLAALRLTDDQRRYPRWVSLAGLVGCLGLAEAHPNRCRACSAWRWVL